MTTLPTMKDHGKVTTTGLWVCVQSDCDGEHHYYEKVSA